MGSPFARIMPSPHVDFHVYSAALRSVNAFHYRGHEPTKIAAQTGCLTRGSIH